MVERDGHGTEGADPWPDCRSQEGVDICLRPSPSLIGLTRVSRAFPRQKYNPPAATTGAEAAASQQEQQQGEKRARGKAALLGSHGSVDLSMGDLVDLALGKRDAKLEKAAKAAARRKARFLSPGRAAVNSSDASSPEVSSDGSGPVAKRQSKNGSSGLATGGALLPPVPLFSPEQPPPPSIAIGALTISKSANALTAAQQKTPQTAEVDGKHAGVAGSLTPVVVPMELRSAAAAAEAWARAPISSMDLGGAGGADARPDEKRRDERHTARDRANAAREKKEREAQEAHEAREAAAAAVLECEAKRKEHEVAVRALNFQLLSNDVEFDEVLIIEHVLREETFGLPNGRLRGDFCCSASARRARTRRTARRSRTSTRCRRRRSTRWRCCRTRCSTTTTCARRRSR